MQTEFSQISAQPPAAFDFLLWEASEAHSQDLLARNAQDHTGQGSKVNAKGVCNGCSIGVFSYTRSALHGHTALNIDWGFEPDGMQAGRGHRRGIMGDPVPHSLTGLALVPGVGGTGKEHDDVGPLIFSGVYCTGDGDEQNRYIVGTVYTNQNGNSSYDEGEGKAGVTVMPDSGTYFAVTGNAGGYAIPITATGSYRLTFFGGALGDTRYEKIAMVVADSMLVDLETMSSPPYDPDTDGDGTPDSIDNCPIPNADQLDTDEDGVGNACDDDDDGDGTSDARDALPLDALEQFDTDHDGIGNNADQDDDNDGVSDDDEIAAGTNPLVDERRVIPIINTILLND